MVTRGRFHKNRIFPGNFMLKMKLIGILIFIVGLTGSYASVYSQNTRLSLDVRDMTIKDIFKQIEEQSEYTFMYNSSKINVSEKINLKVRNNTIDVILKQIFPESVSYRIIDNHVIIFPSEEKSVSVNEQGIKITGKVDDISGSPLPGVTVAVKGTGQGTITDVDGNFVLSNLSDDVTLVFSFIGMKTQEIAVHGQKEINVIMEEESIGLQEVVAVGYGVEKKVNLTGAVNQIDSKLFEERPITSASTALQGALPGLNINPTSGNPDADISFNIRGTTSINGGEPLVLVDGIESSIKLVNPNDIESVTILKDAAASSIYGVRAAFGVILVKTKTGEANDELKINYSGNYSLSKATVMPDFVDDSYTHATFVNKALARESISAMYDDMQVEAIKDYAENPTGKKDYYIYNGTYYYVGHYNWLNTLIKDYSPKQNHNVSFSGGSGKTNFYSSIGYTRQEGVLKLNPDIYKRTNVRLAVENNSLNWLKLGLKTIYNSSEMNEPHTYKDDIYHAIVFSSPLKGGQWQGDEEYPEYDKYIGSYFEDQSPEGYLKYGGRNIDKMSEIILSPSADFQFTKNWTAHADFSYTKTAYKNTAHAKRIDYFISKQFVETEGNTANNNYSVSDGEKDYQSLNLYTNYSASLKDVHHIKATVGFNQELTKYKKYSATRYDLISQEIPSLSLGTGEQLVKSTGYEWALRGGFFRVNYDYDNRYLFEVNGRYDGTSRFPSDDRFVFLPSFSVGWRLTEERFMESTRNLFDNIKLRASYGRLGNQLLSSRSWNGNVKYYPYISFLSNKLTSNYISGSTTSIMVNPSALTPSSLTWEKSTTINGGLDVSMLSFRLDFSLDVYKRITSDMLISSEYPELLGASAPVKNSGELETKGYELSITWKDKINNDFSYSVGFNLYDATSKITKYDGPDATVEGYYEGKRIGEIWGYETDGFFEDATDVASSPSQSFISSSTWTAGDIKYKDLDDSGAINTGANTKENPGDRRVIGNTTPRYNYGINMSANYKNVFLSLFFQGVGKREFYPDAQAFWPVATQYYNTQKWFVTDSWSENNTDAYFPIPRARSTKNQEVQTRYLQDASYLRLKNLTIGYNLPKTLINKVRISNAKIYLSGENIWEKSHIKGPYDPEGIANGGKMYYPFQRVYSFGVDLTF